MIDYIESAKLNNTTIEKLKSWFEKYPNSNKYVIRICDNCDENRKLRFCDYYNLCRKCALNTPEAIEANRLRGIKQWSDQTERDKQSKRRIEHWLDQTNRDAMSEIIKNSEAAKIANEKKRGGNDICEYHYIYDHANPELYTMKVTRSKHTQLHAWMRKYEIKVPHINVTEENKDIFKRRYS